MGRLMVNEVRLKNCCPDIKALFFKNDSLCNTPLCDSCNANKNTGYEARRLMLTMKNNKESGEEYHKRERSTEKKEK